jgi:plastocyanin
MKTHGAFVVGIFAALIGCGEGAAPPSPPPSPPPAAPPVVAAPASADPGAAKAASPGGAGALSGSVKIVGKIPRAPVLNMSQEPKCASKHATPPRSEEVVADDQGHVRWAVVYVKSAVPGEFPVPKEPVVLDQKGCRYEPHVFGIRAGQPLLIKNSDDLLHNVHALPFTNAEFNIGQQPGAEDTRQFASREVVVKVKCDIHPWMGAWAAVLDHPFFAVTDEKGRYEIKGLPAGKHTVEVWQEKYKSVSKDVQVQDKTALDFELTEMK